MIPRIYPSRADSPDGASWAVEAELARGGRALAWLGFRPLDPDRGLWWKPANGPAHAWALAREAAEKLGGVVSIPVPIRERHMARARELAEITTGKRRGNRSSAARELYRELMAAGVPPEEVVMARVQLEKEVLS